MCADDGWALPTMAGCILTPVPASGPVSAEEDDAMQEMPALVGQGRPPIGGEIDLQQIRET